MLQTSRGDFGGFAKSDGRVFTKDERTFEVFMGFDDSQVQKTVMLSRKYIRRTKQNHDFVLANKCNGRNRLGKGNRL